jgi:nucleoside-diphosphate-sugar epimerase
MRVFVTGATGFIGSNVVQELLHAGHQVLGLARSDAGAHALATAGAQVHRGDLEDLFNPDHPNPRKASELAGVAVAERGVNVSVVRLPQVHDRAKQGLISPAIAIARETGVSAYVGDGLNRFPAVHVLDAAPLYRLALEQGAAGARYHAVAEEGVPFRTIAEALGRSLALPVVAMPPEEANAHFGWLGMFIGLDMPASSALTRQRLGWRPTHTGLIDDLDHLEASTTR